MSFQSLLFPNHTPEYPTKRFEPGPVLEPRSANEPKTTHSFSFPANKHTNVTLRLFGSHSPEENLMPLFYMPCIIDGEIVLEADKKDDMRSLVVSVEGINQGPGYAMAETGQGVMGEPGEQATYFWQQKSPNLLHVSTLEPGQEPPSEAASATVGGQRRTFPFSISVPATYIPAPHHHPPHKESLKTKIVSVLKPHAREANTNQGETLDATAQDEGEPEEQPLPRSYLHHDQDRPEMKNQPAVQYSVSVNIAFSSALDPDVNVHQNIVILPVPQDDTPSEWSKTSPAPSFRTNA